MRPAAKGMNSAVYFEIINDGAISDTLYAVKSDLAKLTEMHETYQKGNMTGMRRVNNVVIKPKSSFKFQPGSHHIMLITMHKEMKQGDKATILLRFKRSGDIKINVDVKM
jgi:copper(I)-binding protein